MEQSSAQDAAPPKEVEPADISPEARRRTVLAGGRLKSFRTRLGISSRVIEVMRRVVVGCFNDGTIHAGNLAYMSLLAIFPFFITATAILSAIGSEGERLSTIAAIVRALPPTVAEVIEPVARTVIEARTGWFLWIGAFFGLWTTGSLVETIRDILRRSYGTRATKAFWKYRISSVGIIVAAVLMLIVSLVAQVTISAAQNVIQENFPQFGHALGNLSYTRIVTAIGLFLSIWMLFVALTPHEYRHRRYRKWPGALLVTGWWTLVALAFPPILRSIFAYDLTYGSLAGVMITLFFFWLVGLGIVAGAELNAALAETPEEEEGRLADIKGAGADEKRADRTTADNTEETAR